MSPQSIVLDYVPRPWQQKCHRERKRFSVLALHRRAGKTILGIMELVDSALRCREPLPLFVYIAPQLKQATSIAWGHLKAKIEPLRAAGAVEVREADLAVTFLHNGARIRLFGADNPDALRGVRLDGVVIDEVAQCKPELWHDIVQPALSDRLGWAIFIGTPHGINLFSELFYGAQTKDDWFAGRWTVYDTQAIDATEIARLSNPDTMPPTSFAREYLCDFAAAGDAQLISLSDAEDAARRSYKRGDVAHAPRIVGVDPARFGDDRSVIVKRQGLQVLDPLIFRGIDNMQLAGRVADVIVDWSPDAVFIDSGAGAGVIDRLRQLGHDVVEVPFGGKANDKQFTNRRTEMWWGIRDWLNSGGAIPPDMALRQELATPIYWFDSSGRKVLESKDDIKKRLQGGGSPDIADALALTFASPVVARTPIEEFAAKHRDRNRPRGDYDPYARL